MIAGDSECRTLNNTNPWQAVSLMETGNDGEVCGLPGTLTDRTSRHVRLPSCWDGVHLDSSDHYRHVSYRDRDFGGDTQSGLCPSSHPNAMINIGAEFGWNLNGVTGPSSLVWANGDTTGYGFHADFTMGWEDPVALQQTFAECLTHYRCPWRSLGTPSGRPSSSTRMRPQVSAPPEEIGLSGRIASLPSKNPVYKAVSIRNRHNNPKMTWIDPILIDW